MAKRIELEKLASELFQDITRARMSLSIRPNVMAKLFSSQELKLQFNGFFAHLFDATAVHSFMMIARMFDEPTSRFSVTLEGLVRRVGEEKLNHARVQAEVVKYLGQIVEMRKRIARVRNSVFAHRVSFSGPLPQVEVLPVLRTVLGLI